MKQKLRTATAFGLLMQLMLPRPITDGPAYTDLERLYWLCTDQQLTIQGFVIEGWFVLPDRAWRDAVFTQYFENQEGQQQKLLPDGSIYNCHMEQRKHKRCVEFQLITKNYATASAQYQIWHDVMQRYQIQEPIGVTIVAELPEKLAEETIQQLGSELLQCLHTTYYDQQTDAWGHQMVGYSPQLEHDLNIANQKININLTFQPEDTKTMLYLGTPVIYQQY